MPSRHYYRSEAAYQRNQEASRRAKARRTGSCIDCGTVTRYSGHGAGVSARCPTCAARQTGAKLRGVGANATRLLALLAEGPCRHSEILERLGITHNQASVLLHRQLRHGTIVRLSRGVYALPEEPCR